LKTIYYMAAQKKKLPVILSFTISVSGVLALWVIRASQFYRCAFELNPCAPLAFLLFCLQVVRSESKRMKFVAFADTLLGTEALARPLGDMSEMARWTALLIMISSIQVAQATEDTIGTTHT
jgi:hypothetical protein